LDGRIHLVDLPDTLVLLMLLTVKDACALHPMALEYSMSEQVENLVDVIGATSATAHDFFAKNYVTKGMETLLNQGLRRVGSPTKLFSNLNRPWEAAKRIP
jgi:hypothetical protein